MNPIRDLDSLDFNAYSTILFDADDTLFDFAAAEAYALRALFSELGLTLTPEIDALYQEINGGLWKALEQGSITKKQLTDSRFALLFDRLGQTRDGPVLNERYLDYLSEGSQPFPGAEELCRKLHARGIELDIVTNGITRVQTGRLEKSSLRPYIRHLFISEAVGAAKPSPVFFEHVLNSIAEKDKSRVLVIGDSLSSDICGACNAGLDCCWLSVSSLPKGMSFKPNWHAASIHELLSIL